jgi:hypothetical protein
MGYDYPVWDTLPDLGTFLQDYSFDLNPLILYFGADTNSVITLTNGSLPPGLSFIVTPNSVNIFGAVLETTSIIYSQFTFRIQQTNGAIADRTFYITLNPLLIAPSWSAQTTFLGYQNTLAPATYLLTATTTTSNHILYDIPISNQYSTIETRTGLLTCNANTVLSSTTVTTVVRATDSVTGADSNVTVSIGVVVGPSAPVWLTPAVVLRGTYYGNQFVEFNLVAEDPSGATVYYYIINSSVGFPLKLPTPQPPADSGLLYGKLTDVAAITAYTFTVRAVSVNGQSDRTFSIVVQPSILNAQFVWASSSNLGNYNEGQYLRIPVLAVSQRSKTIVYNVTGGLLPPHLILGTTSGLLEGFCEYTALQKTYYFDLTAYDGYQAITQQFSLTVNKIYSDQFLTAYIPITGTLRDKWQSDTGNIFVREPGTIRFDRILEVEDPPVMNIINGLATNYATPDQIVDVMKSWWHELDLQIGQASNSLIAADGLSIVYRNIVDNQSGSSVTVSNSYVSGGNVFPVSINNIRSSLMSQYAFVTDANGSGFAVFVNLNYNNGGIASVIVLDSGENYTSPPLIVVGGAGTGAQLKAVLGLVKVSVANSGSGWSVGDTITLTGNDANTQAVLYVTDVNSQGGITGLDIVNPGDYNQVGTVSAIPVTNTNNGTAYLNVVWGVVAVNVLESGQGYECGYTISTTGGEILPSWQTSYSPVVELGKIPGVSASNAVNILNYEPTSLWGVPWQPTVMVLQWQGLRFIGSATFDFDDTTFDGNATRFEDTESPIETVFDQNKTVFDQQTTIFDYKDPLTYDLQQVWGSTLIDAGTTVFDLYTTIFDSLAPRTYSNTRLQKWITTDNRIYSGNNAVW